MAIEHNTRFKSDFSGKEVEAVPGYSYAIIRIQVDEAVVGRPGKVQTRGAKLLSKEMAVTLEEFEQIKKSLKIADAPEEKKAEPKKDTKAGGDTKAA